MFGIVLAAGASVRMGAPKALLRWGGETFLGIVCRGLREAGVAQIVVVVGPPHGGLVGVAAADIPGVRVVTNPRPEDGQLASLRCGIEALGTAADAALVALVDHPAVCPSTIRAVLEAFGRGAPGIVQPRHAGRGGHPVLIARPLFAELGAAPLAGGLRAVLKAEPARVCAVEVADPAIYTDVDDPAAYAALSPGGPPSAD